MRCTKHGLALAPDGRCVRCRQEDEAVAAEAMDAVMLPTRRRGTALGAILIVLGLGVAAAAFVASRPQAASAPFPAPVPAGAASLPARATPSAPVASLVPGSGVDQAPPGEQAASDSALQRAARGVDITLYCRPVACARVRQWMLDRGYSFHELDVDADPKVAAAWKAIAPDGTVPAFDVEGQRFAGFDEARVTNAVTYAAAHRLQR